MLEDDVQKLYDLVGGRIGLGAIDIDEVMWFQELIAEHRPQHLVEIGMASGLSAGILAHVLADHGGRKLTTVDYDNTFFGDRTKENGFLIERVYPGGPVEVVKRPNTIAVDLDEIGETFEMAFVDANHQHPFPLLDTLALYPLMTGPKVIVHHDYKLYKEQDVPWGIGPKYVRDAFPDSVVTHSTANLGNIFAIRLDGITKEQLEEIAIEAFLLPWSTRTEVAPWIRRKTRPHLKKHYSEALLEAFNTGNRRYGRKPLYAAAVGEPV